MAFGADEKTTATQSLPKQRTFDASHDRSTGVPTEVIICQETEKLVACPVHLQATLWLPGKYLLNVDNVKDFCRSRTERFNCVTLVTLTLAPLKCIFSCWWTKMGHFGVGDPEHPTGKSPSTLRSSLVES